MDSRIRLQQEFSYKSSNAAVAPLRAINTFFPFFWLFYLFYTCIYVFIIYLSCFFTILYRFTIFLGFFIYFFLCLICFSLKLCIKSTLTKEHERKMLSLIFAGNLVGTKLQQKLETAFCFRTLSWIKLFFFY